MSLNKQIGNMYPWVTHTWNPIEPIFDFGIGILARWINCIHPDFMSLGADSKQSNIPLEPNREKTLRFIYMLRNAGNYVRIKKNLDRITKNK